MQDAQGVASQFREPATETLFASRTDVPGSGALRVIAEREDEPTELRVLGPYPVLSCTLTPLELATCRTARCTGINDRKLVRRFPWGVRESRRGRLRLRKRFRCRSSRRFRIMRQTTDRPRCPLVDGLGARRKVNATDPTGAGVSQLHALLVGRGLLPHVRDRNHIWRHRAQNRRISALDLDKSRRQARDANRRRYDAGGWAWTLCAVEGSIVLQATGRRCASTVARSWTWPGLSGPGRRRVRARPRGFSRATPPGVARDQGSSARLKHSTP